MQNFLIRENPAAAVNALTCIESAATRLTDFPEIGRRLDARPHLRQWYTRFGKSGYHLRYRLTAEGDPYIIRVFHGREAQR